MNLKEQKLQTTASSPIRFAPTKFDRLEAGETKFLPVKAAVDAYQKQSATVDTTIPEPE